MISLRAVFVTLPLIAAIAGLIAGIVVLLGSKHRRVGRSFVMMACCVFLWNAQLAAESIPGVIEARSTLLRLLSLGVMLLPTSIVYNAVVWSEQRISIWVRATYLLGLLLVALQTRGWIFDGFVTTPWGAMGHPGPLYHVYALFMAGAMTISVIGCWRALAAPIDPTVRLRVMRGKSSKSIKESGELRFRWISAIHR